MGSATLQTARKLIKCITAPVLFFLSVGHKIDRMDWTKQKAKNYITIEEAIESLAEGTLDVNDTKEVINATIEKIIAQAEMDVKVVAACRNFMEVVGWDGKNKTCTNAN